MLIKRSAIRFLPVKKYRHEFFGLSAKKYAQTHKKIRKNVDFIFGKGSTKRCVVYSRRNERGELGVAKELPK